MMDKNIDIIVRYISIYFVVNIFFLSFFSLGLGYILTYSSYFVLQLFFDVSLEMGGIVWNNNLFLVVEECIAKSAYILLGFLFLSMPLERRVMFRGMGFSMLAFTFANFIRILILMITFILFGEGVFDKFHLLFYEVLTGVMLGLIFVFYYRKLKIKEKPLISDYKYIFSLFRKK